MAIETGPHLQSRENISYGEKCGVIGVYDSQGKASFLAQRALAAIQHRGQEAAGLSVYTSQQTIQTHHGLGLVVNAIPNQILAELGDTKIAVAHNRYSTVEAGRKDDCNIQPIHLSHGSLEIGLAHNGNLFNTHRFTDLKPEVNNPSDSYLLTAYLLNERQKHQSWKETLLAVLPQISNLGAFSLVIMTDDGQVFGARDPYGIRPLVLGQLDEGWIMASETVSLDQVNARFMREVKHGEIVQITSDGEISFTPFGEPKTAKPCVFEKIYFSHPNSFSGGQRIAVGRENSGRALAQRMVEMEIQPDTVVPVLDSGMFAAIGAAQGFNAPFTPAVTTSHYIGRTFIQPGEDARRNNVKGKHNFIPEKIKGRNIAVIDDSIVRVNTSPRIVKGLRENEAKRVDLGVASPPVVDSCDLGIDTNRPVGTELPASQWAVESLDVIEEGIRELTGVDSMTYLPIGLLAKSLGERQPGDFCFYCLGGSHPIRGEQSIFRQKERPIKGKPKISVFISGSGTNLQQIIDGVKKGDIDGKIISVVSNKPDAYGLIRASQHKVPTVVLPSQGVLKDPQRRKEYEERLIEEIKNNPPDVIVLAGWMVVLGDGYLQKMQELEIPVINLHPALLTRDNTDTIFTSRGEIPVIRGTHAIQDAYNLGLPVSGVTVHQVVSGIQYDVGPVILTEEVRRIDGESPEQWEQRIHQAEYRTLPTALKRVLHIMTHNIDVSKGDYPW